MNFDFSDDQHQFHDSIGRLLADSWTTKDVRANDDGRALWSRLTEIGFHSALIEAEHGGLGLTPVDIVLALEEFGSALAPVQAIETALAAWLISRHGSPAQKARLLPKIATGDLRIALAHQEHRAGYRRDAIELRAGKAAGGYVLDGAKILVPHADTSDCLLVSARTGSGAPAVFICERVDALSFRRHATLDPSLPSFAVGFAGVAVPAESLLAGQGARTVLDDMADASAFAAAALATGVAGKALGMAVDHAKTRTQFGRIIGSFQAVKQKCADMAVALDGARSAIYHAAWALAEAPAHVPVAVSMAKAFCGDASRMICNDSLQVHGGMGFTWEHDLHLYLKRAKVLESAHGNATWHRERIAGLILTEAGDVAAGLPEAVLA